MASLFQVRASPVPSPVPSVVRKFLFLFARRPLGNSRGGYGESGRLFVCMGLEGALGRRVTVGLLLALWYCRRAVLRTQASRRSSVS